MSVYTILKNKHIKEILSLYNIGSLKSFDGISDGITNTNYFLNTDKGKYVITIFEDIKKTKVTKYLKLMNFFSKKGLCAPEIMITKSGGVLTTVEKKPCSIMQKLSGKTVNESNSTLCKSLGEVIGTFHNFSQQYQGMISNSRDIEWIEKTSKKIENHLQPNQLNLIKHCSKVFKKIFSSNLPSGVIHSDLFRDNVLASNNKITGIIDYYYSFNGPLVYELAVIANDWCVNKNGSINAKKYHSFINSYNSVRPITKKEMEQMNNAMIAAGLRFYLSRLVDMIFPKVGEITHIKDPSAFEKILKKRLENK